MKEREYIRERKRQKMAIKKEILVLVNEYIKLTNYKFIEAQSTNNTLHFITTKGTKAKTTPASIKQYIEHKTGKKPLKSIADIFNISKPSKVKREWKAISCSMTTTELAELEAIMNKIGIKTHNQLIRQLLLKFIEANKTWSN